MKRKRYSEEQGAVVFDELEKSRSHLLIGQMHRYFRDTAVGRHVDVEKQPRILPPKARHSGADHKNQVAQRRFGYRPGVCLVPAVGKMEAAAALLDRLMHHCHVVNISGNSYRMREHTDLWQAIHPEEHPPKKTRLRRKESATT